MRADSSRLGVESEWCTFAVNGRFDFSAPRRGPRRGPLGSKAPAKAAKQYACPMDQVGSIYLLLLAARFVWEPTRGTQRRPWSGIVSWRQNQLCSISDSPRRTILRCFSWISISVHVDVYWGSRLTDVPYLSSRRPPARQMQRRSRCTSHHPIIFTALTNEDGIGSPTALL